MTATLAVVARFNSLLGCAAVCVVIACGGGSSERSASTGSVQQNEASANCGPPQCIGIDTAEAAIGFRPLEPTHLPDRYALNSRQLLVSEPIAGVPKAATKPRPALLIDYRFLGSVRLPGLQVSEQLVTTPEPLNIEFRSEGCGEVVDLSDGQAFYGQGSADLEPTDDLSQWFVCIGGAPMAPGDENLLPYWVVLTIDHVIVEISGFPESGLTRDEILRVAGSLRPAP